MAVPAPVDEQMYNLTEAVANDLVSGKKEEEVIRKLTADGLPPMTARTFVHQFQPLLQEVKAEKYRNRMLSSSLWMATNILIASAVTTFANQYSAWVLLCWLGVIASAFYLILNFTGWLKTR